MKRYNPKELEPKWQKWWIENGTYEADLKSEKPKYMASGMFNYPSGDGIHVGHSYTFTIPDVLARYKRQQGYESLNPVGWDSFGLPAENYAIKVGVSPQKSMAKIIPNYHKQYTAMGWGVDWTKEIDSSQPIYYKWTQWIFSQMYKKGLAYQGARMQWWCDQCQTVLANEQVIDGKCWRHDKADDPLIEKKEVKQWFFKITEYADELLEAIDDLNWTDSVKLAQKNWIGKSVGAEINFRIRHSGLDSESSKNARSYIMGQKDITKEDIEAIGGSVDKVTDAGYLCVTFPRKSAKQFEVLIVQKMEPGFWNEYLGDETVFIFKHKDGKIERFVLSDETHDTIRKLGQAFNNQEDNPSVQVEDWLKNNEWYKDWILNQARLSGRQVQDGGNETITVFTTRPDTLFGATFMVLAPENELLDIIVSDEQKEAVSQYVREAAKKTEVERQASKEKTGVFTGAYAINPVNNEPIPIWVADYVLAGYGTGAIMAVPAHDERDYEFAQTFNLPIKQVVASYEVYGGTTTPRKDVETIQRRTVDAIIVDQDGKYLLQSEGEQTHFVGGGVDPGDENPTETVKREVIEETGYTNIVSIKQVAPAVAGVQYRHTKNKNQQGAGGFYEVTLLNKDSIPSEVDEGKHTLQWVDKEQVARLLTWKWHKDAWGHYLDNQDPQCYFGEGVAVNSETYDFMPSSEVREKIVADLAKKGLAKEKVNYKMRDWSVSRQRYWGAPIPIVNCQKCGQVLVPDEDLPVVLPELEDFKPSGDGRSALARATEWLKVDCPQCGGEAERETDTLDTYIDSSWYLYRYLDPHNEEKIFESEPANKWMPIDFYDGADHATAHLLYARFIARFFNKIGLVENPEPIGQMLYHGKILASDGSNFSKSAGNGVDPLEVIESGYGADALRTYLMFAAPVGFNIRWDPQGVPGAYRFLSRLWTLTQEYLEPQNQKVTDKNYKNNDLLKETHQAIKRVTEDIEEDRYNTAIAKLMEFTNSLYKFKKTIPFSDQAWRGSLESLIAMTAPFAPHITEELWQQLGHSESVHLDTWPKWDDKYLVSDNVNIVIQINGKVRANIEVSADSDEEAVSKAAQENEKVAEYITGNSIKKTIYVKNKLINFVV